LAQGVFGQFILLGWDGGLFDHGLFGHRFTLPQELRLNEA
jgi:hypothetical protein